MNIRNSLTSAKSYTNKVVKRLSKRDNAYVRALMFLGINVFGSFLALIAVAVMIGFKTTESPHAFQLIRNGEVIIICISLIISALYTLYENLKSKKTGTTLLFWSNILIAILAILFYPLLIEKQVLEMPIELNSQTYLKQYRMIKTVSIVLLCFTVLSTYIIQVIQYQNWFSSPMNQREDQFNELKEKFNTENK